MQELFLIDFIPVANQVEILRVEMKLINEKFNEFHQFFSDCDRICKTLTVLYVLGQFQISDSDLKCNGPI